MSCSGPPATASVCCCDAISSAGTSSIGIWVWSRQKEIRQFRLVRSGDFSLLMNSVLSPERMIDISLLIAAHFVSVMVHVPSFPFGSPSWTDVRLTCHNDTAFVMHVIPHGDIKCCPLCCLPGTTCIPALNPSVMTCFLWRKPKSSPWSDQDRFQRFSFSSK